MFLAGLYEMLAEILIKGVCHGGMLHFSRLKGFMKGDDSMAGEINKLVQYNEIAWGDFFFEGTYRSCGEDVGATRLAKSINICPVVDLSWRNGVFAAMPGQQCNISALDSSQLQGTAGTTVSSLKHLVCCIFKQIRIIQTTAANYSNSGHVTVEM